MAITTSEAIANPGTITSVDFGGNPWSNGSNVASSNDTYATASVDAAGSTDRLRCSNFGFAIPDHAIVTGIKVTVEAKVGAAGVGTWNLLCYISNNIQSDQYSAQVSLAATDTVFTIGGDRMVIPGDLVNGFRESAKPLFGGEVNDPGFNIDIVFDNNPGTTATVSIDHVQVTVYYTTGYRVLSTGAKLPGTVASKYNDAFETPAAGSAWTNVNNILTSNDTYATNTVLATTGVSAQLRATNFGFAIPANAIVIGAKMEIDHKSDAAGDVFSSLSGLALPGSSSFEDSFTDVREYPLNETQEVDATERTTTRYANMWLGSSFANNTDFGFLFYYTNTGGTNSVVSVDVVRMTLYYIVLPLNISNTGVVAPSAVTEEDNSGCAWTNEGNTLTSNNAYGTVLMDRGTAGFSNNLVFSGFTLSSIPDDAIVAGLAVNVEQKIGTLNSAIFPQAYIRLEDAASGFFGDNFAPWFAGYGATPTTSDAVATIGGSGYFLGFGTNQIITGKMLKDANLAVSLNYLIADGDTTDQTVSVDAVTLTVYYAQALKAQVKSPGTTATIAGDGGTDDWTNVANIVSSNDTYATVALDSGTGDASYQIKATNFGFNIPTGATILGMRATIELKDNSGADTYGAQGMFIKDNTYYIYPTFSAFTLLETSDNKLHGGWSFPHGGGVTPAQVNASTFGILFFIAPFSGTPTVSVDHIEIEVLYSLPNQSAIMAAMI